MRRTIALLIVACLDGGYAHAVNGDRASTVPIDRNVLVTRHRPGRSVPI